MVKGRLERGRDKLRARLTRTGIALSAATLHAALTSQAASGAVVATLATATLKASLLSAGNMTAAVGVIPAQVFTLTKEVTKTMFLTKVKIATVVTLAVGAAGTGTATISYLLAKAGRGDAAITAAVDDAPQQENPAPAAARPENKEPQKGKTDMEKIQGTWRVVSAKAWDEEGKEVKGEQFDKIAQLIKEKKLKVMFTGEKLAKG